MRGKYCPRLVLSSPPWICEPDYRSGALLQNRWSPSYDVICWGIDRRPGLHSIPGTWSNGWRLGWWIRCCNGRRLADIRWRSYDLPGVDNFGTRWRYTWKLHAHSWTTSVGPAVQQSWKRSFHTLWTLNSKVRSLFFVYMEVSISAHPYPD